MKRICLMGAAVAGLFTAGITSAATAATPATSRPRAVAITARAKTTSRTARVDVSCKLALATQIPAGSTSVTQGTTTGKQYGTASCGGPLFAGVTHDSFAADAGGNLSGPMQQWFRTGALHGSYTLAPSQPPEPPTPTTFATESYAGTLAIASGSGYLRDIHGRGTLSCTTTDGAHYSCSETLKLIQRVRVRLR